MTGGGEIERQGGCLCGAVRFEARGRPKRVGLCHCVTCRRMPGSAFHVFAVSARANVTVTGATRSFEAPLIPRHFCPQCGAHLFLLDPPTGDEIELLLGAFDAPQTLAPEYQLWTVRRLPWLPEIPGLQSFERDREGTPPGA